MGYDPILGVGREPQQLPTIRNFDTGTINEDLISGATETTANVSLSSPTPQKLFAVQVSISPSAAGGVPLGSLTNERINIIVDNQIIGTYVLPSSNNWGYIISDMLPVNIDLYPTSSLIVTNASDSGTSYNVFIRVIAYVVPR